MYTTGEPGAPLYIKAGTADEDTPLVDYLERARASLLCSGGRCSSSCLYTGASLRHSSPALPVANLPFYLADDYSPVGRSVEEAHYKSAQLGVAE